MPTRSGSEPKVYINGAYRPEYEVLSVQTSMGARTLDHAVLRLDVGRRYDVGDPLQNLELANWWAGRPQYCEVRSADEGAPPLHFGAIDMVDPSLTQHAGPEMVLTSRLEPHHFGNRLMGPEMLTGGIVRRSSDLAANTITGQGGVAIPQWTFGPAAGGDATNAFLAHEDVVFNPVYHGHLVGNRSSRVGDHGRYFFFDVGQSRTAAAILYRQENNVVDPRIVARVVGADLGATGQYWTLAQAIYYLCWSLNPDQRLITNPDQTAALESKLLDHSGGELAGGLSPILRNVKLPRHEYLPFYLDFLLHPWGYDWFVKHVASGTRTLEFVRIGQGDRKAIVGYQATGFALDPQQSPLEEFSLQYDVAGHKLVNAVVILGAPLVYESTFELIPAWDSGLNGGIEWQQTDKDSLDFKTTPRLRRFARDWVLNEAGDYVGNKVPDHAQAGHPYLPITTAFDINEHLGLSETVFAQRRRRFWSVLTLDDYGRPLGEQSGGMLVEVSRDDAATWEEIGRLGITTTHVRLLTDECGIRFDHQFAPELFLQEPHTIRVRVTACVEADVQLVGYWSAAQSPNPEEIPVVLNMPWYAYAVQHVESSLWVKVQDGTWHSSARDDSLAIVEHAKQLVAAWNQAECAGNLVLDGIDFTGYQLGDVVEKIAGREIALATSIGEPQHFPQIVAITWDVKSQRMTLSLDSLSSPILKHGADEHRLAVPSLHYPRRH